MKRGSRQKMKTAAGMTAKGAVAANAPAVSRFWEIGDVIETRWA
jgi:hypothetical protein